MVRISRHNDFLLAITIQDINSQLDLLKVQDKKIKGNGARINDFFLGWQGQLII